MNSVETMFISNRLAYLELHKTGSQQISLLLNQYCSDGTQSGYHNRLPKTFEKHRYIIGSIRNPWDWYVSLWAYGCNSSGGLRVQLTQKPKVLKSYYKWIFFKPYQVLAALSNSQSKPTSLYADLYSDVNNPQLFRQWLTTILDFDRRFDLGESYGFSPFKGIAGFLTFRYFKLYCRSQIKLFSTSFNTVKDIKNFDGEHNVLDFVIRNESLELDFIKALGDAGYKLNPNQIDSICDRKKINTSKHRETKYYYDKETSELVSRQEAFIVDKFGYNPPTIE